MSYLDEDAVNQLVREDRHQEVEERALKNRLLSMTNTEKKQELWRRNFPHINYPKTDLIF